MSREHDTNSVRCWCRPRLERACPACDGSGKDPGSDWGSLCWICRGFGRVEAEPDEDGILIVHNEDAEVGMQLERRDGSGSPRWPPREDLEGSRPPAEGVEVDVRPWWSKPPAMLALAVTALAMAVILASC